MRKKYNQSFLKDLCVFKIRTGCVLARSKIDKTEKEKKKYKVLTLKSVTSRGEIVNEDLEDFKAKEEIKDEFIAKVGDVVIRLRTPNIAVFIDEKKEGLLISSLFSIIRVDKEKILPEYLAYFLNSDNVKKQTVAYIKGTAINTLKSSVLENIKVPLPVLAEQEKITKLIRLQNEDIKLLEELKEKKEKLFREQQNFIFN